MPACTVAQWPVRTGAAREPEGECERSDTCDQRSVRRLMQCIVASKKLV